MRFNIHIQKPREINRVLLILMMALVIVELFFLSLVLIPNAQDNGLQREDVNPDETVSGTREIDANAISEADKKAQRLEKWQKFSAELSERFKGKDYAIAFRSLNDPDFALHINDGQDFIAASTYKLFAAYAMFTAGNPPACLDSMIIYSENECSVNYLERYGWSKITLDAHRVGATYTSFGADTHTTANDLAILLQQIYDGSLLDETDNNRLLSDMKEQVFREGIPAGIPEAQVADKVGFLDGLLHDAGIVYSPKGDFILVILTDGYSWESIAEISAEIYSAIDF